MSLLLKQIILVFLAAILGSAVEATDKFKEELVITRLPSGELLSHFRFVLSVKSLGVSSNATPKIFQAPIFFSSREQLENSL